MRRRHRANSNFGRPVSGANSLRPVQPFMFPISSVFHLADTEVNLGSHCSLAYLFPPCNFRHYLTLFSQFFSTFLRSTFSLSVSVSYLGFDEIYHQLYAEFPNYATLNDAEIRGRGRELQDSHLLRWRFPSHFAAPR